MQTWTQKDVIRAIEYTALEIMRKEKERAARKPLAGDEDFIGGMSAMMSAMMARIELPSQAEYGRRFLACQAR